MITLSVSIKCRFDSVIHDVSHFIVMLSVIMLGVVFPSVMASSKFSSLELCGKCKGVHVQLETTGSILAKSLTVKQRETHTTLCWTTNKDLFEKCFQLGGVQRQKMNKPIMPYLVHKLVDYFW